MSDQGTRGLGAANSDQAEPFKTLAELQNANLALLDDADDREGFHASVRQFIARACATGAHLDRVSDRRSAQATIDYWTTSLILAPGVNVESVTPTPLAPFDPDHSAGPEADESPYQGLAAFSESDASRYFGRESVCDSLADLVSELPLVFIAGPPDSGKTSLVRAGLMPLLRSGTAGSDGTHELLDVVVPGDDLLASLVRAIMPSDASTEAIATERGLVVKTPKRLAEIADKRPKPIILIVDPFETAFGRRGDGSRKEDLSDALSSLFGRHRVVLVANQDQPNRPTLPGLDPQYRPSKSVFVPRAVTPRELRRIIEKPAESVGLRIDEIVINELIKEVVDDTAALPLLQFILHRLWSKRARNRITWGAYQELGGSPRRALAKAAEEVFAKLSEEEKKVTENVFCRLVTPSGDATVERHRLDLGALSARATSKDVEMVLKAFGEAMVLRAHDSVEGQPRYDIIHESLATQWPRLAQWLNDRRAGSQSLLRLLSLAKLWETSSDPTYLLSGKALAEAKALGDPTPDLKRFITASERAAVDQARWKRLYQFLGGALTMIALLLAYIVVKEQNQRQERAGLNAENAAARKQLVQVTDELNSATRRLDRIYGAIVGGNLPELSTVLKEIGVPPDAAARLQLELPPGNVPQPASGLPQRAPDNLTQTVDQQSTPVVKGDAGACAGVVWIGSPENSKVREFPTQPTGLKDKPFVLTANIVLRAGFPPPSYIMTPSIAVVSQGTQVIATGDARAIPRPAGAQWFLPVDVPKQVCTTVFIQYTGSADKAAQLSERLQQLGYQVPKAQELAQAAGLYQVRYSDQADESVAKLVAQDAASFISKPVETRPLTLAKATKGIVELWIDLR